MQQSAAPVGNVNYGNVVGRRIDLAFMVKLPVDSNVRLQYLVCPEIQIIFTVRWRIEYALAAHGEGNHRILSNSQRGYAVEPNAGYVALSYICLACDFYEMVGAERISGRSVSTAQQRRT